MDEHPALPAGGRPAHRNPRLLLAEDDPSTRALLCEILAADYEVECAADGEQAWEAAMRNPPDIVLSDVLMPVLTGIDLVRRLRGHPRTATTPVLLLTGHSDKAMLLEGLDAGADDFLSKPFQPAELLARLRCHRQLIQLRREAAEHEGDSRFRLIVESARDYAIFTFDAERRVTSWNPGAEAITGYLPAEIIGQPVDLIYTPEDRESEVPAQEAQGAQETGRFDNERWHLRKDGTRFWGSGVVMPMRESGPEPGFLKILRDITPFHNAEAARRQAEDRFALVIQSIQDYAIYMLDTEGLITTWNRGAERIKGYTQQEVLGRHFSICFTPEEIAAGHPNHKLDIAAEHGRYHEENWRVRKNGERFWADELIVPLRDQDGQLLAFAKFCRDLSEQRSHEEERARLLAAEKAAREEAEAANRTKDRFLAALSHELRTPLSPIQMALYVMAREEGLSDSVQDGLEMIRRNVEIEVRLIGDLLDVSRIVHGKLELKSELLDLHAVFRSALEICREDLSVRHLRLGVDLAAARSVVVGEAARLQQVFWNLLQNAAKFTPEGGEIRVQSANEDGQIVISVADTGLGIEPGALRKIFDPFEQGDPDRARLHGGLGLGLAISHAIVVAHGGQLTAASPGRNRGATFCVRLSTAGKDGVSMHPMAAPAGE